MSDSELQKPRPVEEAESKLSAALREKDAPLSTYEPILLNYRSACQQLMLGQPEVAASRHLEDKLWDAHVRVNGRFRKHLGYFRDLKGKKKPVEQRKAAKQYLNFIKSSQRFYRDHVRRLASRFGGIPELELVAQKFSQDAVATMASTETVSTTPGLQHALLQSCHQTLIHLGDLSRYQEFELGRKEKDRNWGPAIGYYDLAIAVNPSSGTPFNQLAIISKAEDDHARALYYLYRAQSAFEPPSTAWANLQLEFKKIREASERKSSAAGADRREGNPLADLQRRLPLLHARCFGGIELAEYDELESSVLGQLTDGLKEWSLETSFVNRMVLSNVAADFTAGDRWQDAPDIVQNELALKLFQRLNIRTYFALLQLLHTECKHGTTEGIKDQVDFINPVVRRLLPPLRHYSFWLISRAALLSAHLDDPVIGPLIKDFWTVYVGTLTLILSGTSFEELPRLDYLLEEDEEIIGFAPLQEGQSTQAGTARKAKCQERGVKRHHPNIEMRCRVRDMVEDAIGLSHSEYVPVNFIQDTGCFVVQEDWPELGPSQASLRGGAHHVSTAAEETNASQLKDISLPDAESTTDDAVSQGTSPPVSLSTSINRMVDDLVGPEPGASAASPPLTPPAPTLTSAQSNGLHQTSYGVGDSTLTALDFVNKVRPWSLTGARPQDYPKPSLPSDLNSPFVYQAEREPALSRPITSHKRQQSQSQQLPTYTVESSASSMSEPTQQSFMRNGHLLHPALRNKIFGKRQHHGSFSDEFSFDSSNIVAGSSFPYNTRDHVSQPAPPNGQG